MPTYTPPTRKQAKEELLAAIENLYSAFSKYELKENIVGCSHCVHAEDDQLIRSAPLRELPLDALKRYSQKAMTTWGDVDDFRHFLPHILELLSQKPLAFVEEIVFGKLSYGEWWRWPNVEQMAIERYMRALWGNLLVTPIPYEHSYTEEYLCCFGLVLADLSPFLKMWELDSRRTARRHLACFAWENQNELLEDRLQNAFWDRSDETMRQVIDWLSRQKIDDWST